MLTKIPRAILIFGLFVSQLCLGCSKSKPAEKDPFAIAGIETSELQTFLGVLESEVKIPNAKKLAQLFDLPLTIRCGGKERVITTASDLESFLLKIQHEDLFELQQSMKLELANSNINGVFWENGGIWIVKHVRGPVLISVITLESCKKMR